MVYCATYRSACQCVPVAKYSLSTQTVLGRLVVAEDGVGALLKGLEPRIARVAIAQVRTEGVLSVTLV